MRYCLFLILLTVACTDESNNTSPPNIVLFLIDDYGYADISYEGNTQIQTPNIDRIAREGMRFSRFYQSSAACAPTRASLLTGRYHLKTGLWGVHWGRDYIHPDEKTLGDVFQEAGYVTGAFGKWHSGKSAGYHSWNRGFDVGLETPLYIYRDSKVLWNNKLVNFERPVTDLVGDQVTQFIKANKDRPFLAYVPFQAIHEPFNCPPEIFEKYKQQGYSNHVARLYGMIEVLDDNIGKILNTLDELSLTKNTVVLFLVDDGHSPGYDLAYSNRRMNEEEKAERERGWSRKLRGSKASIWEGGSISPFYIRWPDKLIAGKHVNQVTGVIDILPTLAEISGIDLSEHPLPLDGRSFYPLLKDPNAAWEDRYYFDNTNFYQIPTASINMNYPEMREISVVHNNYKYVRINHKLYTGKDSLSHYLFDLATDPQEADNLAVKLPDQASLLQKKAEQWYDSILNSGRAFPTPVFQVGYPGESSTFINGDAFYSISPGLKREGFPIGGWKEVGDALEYSINVLEEGTYQVELWINPDPNGEGAQLQLTTPSDSVLVSTTSDNRLLSNPIRLEKGQQQLKIKLHQLSAGGAGINQFRHMVIHKTSSATSKGAISIQVGNASEGEAMQVFPTQASIDFFTIRNEPDTDIYLSDTDILLLRPHNEKEVLLKKVTVWKDFEKSVEIKSGLNQTISIPIEYKGKITWNVEMVDQNDQSTVFRFQTKN